MIVASFQSQYGIRLTRELSTGMKWDEFQALLIGIGPETVLGRVVSIRSETNKDILKNFSPEQKRIRNEWLAKWSKKVKKQDMEQVLKSFRQAFISMAGGDPSLKK